MKKIEAKIIADSKDLRGNRITSFLLTYPRFIHGELMTHRMFSRNSASSRAIPFNKMVKMVEEDPFTPIAWQKDHKGMQGTKYMIGEDANQSKILWAISKNEAIGTAIDLYNHGTTKQLCNRLLEPFMWHTVLVTATEFDNFFNLRCPKYYYEPENKYFKSKKDYSNYWFENFGSGIEEAIEGDPTIWWLEQSKSGAEIHIQALAESMWDAMNESVPVELQEGEWHIPFSDKIDTNILSEMETDCKLNTHNDPEDVIIGIATARCARLSYMTFDGEVDYEKDIKLHDILLANGHASPFEHIAQCLTEEEYCSLGKNVLINGQIEYQKGWVDNFRGFKSYRRILNFS